MPSTVRTKNTMSNRITKVSAAGPASWPPWRATRGYQMSNLDRVLSAADAGMKQSLERLFALLRIPSLSADPSYAKDCRRAGQWLVDELNALGFKADLRATAGQPMVVAHYDGASKGPHALFYGHYDVQPADPLEKWKTPPFEP